MEELAGRGLGVGADGSHSPGGLGTGDLLSFDQFLDQHDGRVGSGLDQAIDEQSPVLIPIQNSVIFSQFRQGEK